MQDVACFLVLGANADIRRDAEKWIANDYLVHLADLLHREGKKVPAGFTEEKVPF